MDQILQTCDMQRTKHVLKHIPEVIEETRTNFRVLPIYEMDLSKNSLKKHYSLETNEFLQCRWRRFLEKYHTTGAKRSKPYQIPCHGDLHFFNGQVLYKPSESLFRKRNFKFNCKPGPGFDEIGEIPIPNEMKFKRVGSSSERQEQSLITTSINDVETPSNSSKDNVYVEPSRLIRVHKVEKKTNLVQKQKDTRVVLLAHPISGKNIKKPGNKLNKVTKTTIQVTEEATVKVNKEKHKIMVQNKCTVAVHNRRKSTLV